MVIFVFSVPTLHLPFYRVPVQMCFSVFERADFQPAVLSVVQEEYFLSVQMRGVPPFLNRGIEFEVLVRARGVPLKLCFSFSMPQGVFGLRLAVRGP